MPGRNSQHLTWYPNRCGEYSNAVLSLLTHANSVRSRATACSQRRATIRREHTACEQAVPHFAEHTLLVSKQCHISLGEHGLRANSRTQTDGARQSFRCKSHPTDISRLCSALLLPGAPGSSHSRIGLHRWLERMIKTSAGRGTVPFFLAARKNRDSPRRYSI